MNVMSDPESESSFQGKRLCLFTCLLMGDPESTLRTIVGSTAKLAVFFGQYLLDKILLKDGYYKSFCFRRF